MAENVWVIFFREVFTSTAGLTIIFGTVGIVIAVFVIYYVRRFRNKELTCDTVTHYWSETHGCLSKIMPTKRGKCDKLYLRIGDNCHIDMFRVTMDDATRYSSPQ